MIKILFDKIFDNTKRRIAILSKWLATIPDFVYRSKVKVYPQQVFEYYIRSIAIEEADFKVFKNYVKINKYFTISLVDGTFKNDEKQILRTLPVGNYNGDVLTKKHRELLLRDFITIVIKCKNDFPAKRKRWPLYVLMVLQKLIYVEEHYYLPLLQDAHRCLQNQADVFTLPIHTNRQFLI
jgi:hypothetical protein